MNILICDDNRTMRVSLRAILEDVGHTVVAEASNGYEAIELYQQVKPDACILDITMPEVDGIATLKKIKQIDPAAKVVMCTANEDQISMIESLQSGAMGYVTKPFSSQRLIESLGKI